MSALSIEGQRAVTDLLNRYATGIDSRDWVLFRSCFTDDCDADYGDIGHWHGGDEITAWMSQTHDPLGHTMHRITNVTVSQEDGHLKTRCYVHAIVVVSDDSAVHAFGFYDDEIVIEPNGPAISRRRFTSVTTELHPPSS
jgi:3-phenylpropionate/cinnamic acid dioxygenase small subunit